MDNKKELKQQLGYFFWSNVDKKRKDISLAEISKKEGLNYQLIKAQRSDNTLPRVDEAYKIANAIGTTCEYLVTGKALEEKTYAEFLPYIENMQETDPEKLRIIREMLGMPKKTEDISSSGAKAV